MPVIFIVLERLLNGCPKLIRHSNSRDYDAALIYYKCCIEKMLFLQFLKFNFYRESAPVILSVRLSSALSKVV